MKPPIERKGRTVKLSLDVNEKMEKVAETYGLSCNAYLLMRLGEAVTRDYMAIQSGSALSTFQKFSENEDFVNLQSKT